VTLPHAAARLPYRNVVLLVLPTLVVALGAAGCRRTPVPVAGRLTVVSGQAEIGRPGEERRETTGSRDLRPGDGVRVRDGSTVIRLSGGREVELRSGSDVELRATDDQKVVQPTLRSGDLLVHAPSEVLTVMSGAEEIAVRGTARISRGLALLVASYEGSATVSSAARSVVVPALRQVAIPAAGLFPVRPSPLDFSPDDAWDQRYLSGAIGLSAELLGRSRGFSAQQVGTEGRTAGFFRALLPGLEAEPTFDSQMLSPSRLSGETLIGAAIALEGRKGSFLDRWTAIFGFHDEGAPWGLVAMDQEVDRVPLLAAIERAITRSPTSFALARPGAGSPPVAPPVSRPPSSVPVGAPPAGPANRPAPPTTRLAPTTTPTSVAPVGPINTGTPVVDNTVNGLVNTLNGLLNSLGRP